MTDRFDMGDRSDTDNVTERRILAILDLLLRCGKPSLPSLVTSLFGVSPDGKQVRCFHALFYYFFRRRDGMLTHLWIELYHDVTHQSGPVSVLSGRRTGG